MPFVGPEIGIRDVAMPIVASGNMQVPREEMLMAILAAAGRWMEFGLALDRLRIVMHAYQRGHDAAIAVFDDFAHGVQRRPSAAAVCREPQVTPATSGDEGELKIFISYAHADGRPSVDEIRSHIAASAPGVRILVDVVHIDVGMYWQTRISDLIQSSNVVIVVAPKASGDRKSASRNTSWPGRSIVIVMAECFFQSTHSRAICLCFSRH